MVSSVTRLKKNYVCGAMKQQGAQVNMRTLFTMRMMVLTARTVGTPSKSQPTMIRRDTDVVPDEGRFRFHLSLTPAVRDSGIEN